MSKPEEDRPRLTREELAELATRPKSADYNKYGQPATIAIRPRERDALVSMAQRTVAAEAECEAAKSNLHQRRELHRNALVDIDAAVKRAERAEAKLAAIAKALDQTDRDIATVRSQVFPEPEAMMKAWAKERVVLRVRRLLQEG